MKKDSRKLKTLKLSRETLGALNDMKLRAVAGGLTRLCDGTTDCTDSCGAGSCPILSCGGGNTCLC
jgi:hypothetical protein